MERITDKIGALPPHANYFSLEFFPPKTSMGSANLRARLERMSKALRPLFVTVTWGAGGSTATKSLELAELCQRDLGLTTCLHLTCTNMTQGLVDTALEEAKVLGIRNILALRGDPPRKEEYGGIDSSTQSVEFKWAIDLVRYIREKYGDYFCIGVAAYPEGHSDESHPTDQSLEHDLPYLVEKVKAGADFIMTQLFFDVEAYDNFEERLRNHESGTFKEIPIIPGMMPIQSYQILKRTTKLSHAKLPDDIGRRLDAVKGDDEMVKKVGVDIVSEIVEKVKVIKSRSPGPKGFHFYTLNLEKAVAFILERTHLINSDPAPTIDITDADFAIVDEVRDLSLNRTHGTNGSNTPNTNGFIPPSFEHHRPSIGSDPHNRVVVDNISNPSFEAQASEAGQHAPINTRANTLAISEGEGSLGREATWDDFPNGRWGDARSPAYGEIDGYGVSLHMSINSAIRLWGHPKSSSDITELFIKHIKGELSAIPWSEEGLSPETSSIEEQLLKINAKGWWTVASQPAVNGIRSNDAVFGWGPKNGFVFQKAFVELFVPSSSWKSLLPRLHANQSISFYAMNGAGDFASSDPPEDPSNPTRRGSEPKLGSTNAVTWGAFPGKEIITPTIIEEVSFRAWAEEAFGIWAEWERVYAVGSAERKCLAGERRDRWLVNVICHDYVETDCLWDFLLEA